MEAGRIHNILYLQGMMVLFVDIGYFLGWLQKRYELKIEIDNLHRRKYIVGVTGFALLGSVLCFFGEPPQLTCSHALITLNTQELKQYGEDYWENVELFHSKEKEITINNLANIPSVLLPLDAENWDSGLRLFYRKEKINFR